VIEVSVSKSSGPWYAWLANRGWLATANMAS
jgi:hypothetical protein